MDGVGAGLGCPLAGTSVHACLASASQPATWLDAPALAHPLPLITAANSGKQVSLSFSRPQDPGSLPAYENLASYSSQGGWGGVGGRVGGARATSTGWAAAGRASCCRSALPTCPPLHPLTHSYSGPTPDFRVKPDILAPGTITSAAAGTACGTATMAVRAWRTAGSRQQLAGSPLLAASWLLRAAGFRFIPLPPPHLRRAPAWRRRWWRAPPPWCANTSKTASTPAVRWAGLRWAGLRCAGLAGGGCIGRAAWGEQHSAAQSTVPTVPHPGVPSASPPTPPAARRRARGRQRAAAQRCPAQGGAAGRRGHHRRVRGRHRPARGPATLVPPGLRPRLAE